MTEPDIELINGDCLSVIEENFDRNEFHAIVTDPPYGLAFMGQSWDDFEPREYQNWCEEWATAASRVLKPGGHLLAFSGNRTHHRLFSGVEDAGLEIRDTITWHHGEGFPKGLDVSDEIDKASGEARKELAEKLRNARESSAMSRRELADIVGCTESSIRDWEEGRRREEGGSIEWVVPSIEYRNRLSEVFQSYPMPAEGERIGEYAESSSRDGVFSSDRSGFDSGSVTAPGSELAGVWNGWNTQLKPATEFVVVARNPLSEGTVAENVIKHGTGALNVGACQIPTNQDLSEEDGGGFGGSDYDYGDNSEWDGVTEGREGRHPANVVFDEAAAAALDTEVGRLDAPASNSRESNTGMFDPGTHEKARGYNDPGGPSRYFYTAKASKSERTLDGQIDNSHPTVKPVDLMEWLVTLVTAERQRVLDPFMGSGTTPIAAFNLGRDCVGIEKEDEYFGIAENRFEVNRQSSSGIGSRPKHRDTEAGAW